MQATIVGVKKKTVQEKPCLKQRLKTDPYLFNLCKAHRTGCKESTGRQVIIIFYVTYQRWINGVYFKPYAKVRVQQGLTIIRSASNIAQHQGVLLLLCPKRVRERAGQGKSEALDVLLKPKISAKIFQLSRNPERTELLHCSYCIYSKMNCIPLI